MKAAVITFPGSNCDDDAVFTLEKVGFRVDRLWHKDTPDLSNYQLIVLPGGFSYGDYLRCGAIASLAPIMEKVKAFAEQGGFVIGICNGFQILCESGLLPGAVARNSGLRFICRDVNLKVGNHDTPWTSEMKAGEVVVWPIAHGDGRFVISDDGLKALKEKSQVLFYYSDAGGKVSPESNPNGSLENIAGICNEKRNVFGLMPHPERASDLRSLHGMKLWNSLKKAIEQKAV